MKLSIIIPLYNSGQYLPTCVDSIFDQGLNDSQYELIIVDDGSTDDSLQVAKKYADVNLNITIITKDNGGVGSARNKGMAAAKGDYIYFIDPDDYLNDKVLPRLMDVASNNDLDILTFISRSIQPGEVISATGQNKNAELSDITNGLDYIANHKFQNEVWWYLIKRSFLEDSQIKFIEDRWMEDAILTAQLFINASRMAKLSLDGHRHVTVKGSAMKSKEPEHYLKVIDDNRNAALVFEPMITALEKSKANSRSIKRLRTRQQSFVFFMMVRMLKSTISLSQVKAVLNELSLTKAYPMNMFVGEDYKGMTYRILTNLFNNKNIYFLLFRIFNPILKRL